MNKEDEIYLNNISKEKSTWIKGEWTNEPDLLEWIDEEFGLECIIARSNIGGLCGYVSVPKGNKFFGVDYEDMERRDDEIPDVHGGLTYSGFASADKDKWKFGFDCAHLGDVVPALQPFISQYFSGDGWTTYKNIEFVKRNVKELARFLSKGNKND